VSQKDKSLWELSKSFASFYAQQAGPLGTFYTTDSYCVVFPFLVFPNFYRVFLSVFIEFVGFAVVFFGTTQQSQRLPSSKNHRTHGSNDFSSIV
jgi:hypothetical protein